jgi:ubiquinone/menaquinone biosynthesis C-methylase UbiE
MAMPRITIDSAQIREIYDRLAPVYDRREALLELLLLRQYRRKLLSWAQGRVLEVAIGTGRNLPYYPPGCRITGVDLSAEMLKFAERRAARLGRDVALLPMDAHDLSFPDGSFDTVVSSLSLCTIIDPIQALTEMARVTVPGGRILLLEHGRSPHRWVSWALDRLTPRHVRRYGCHLNRNIVVLAQAADLVILNVESHLLGILQLIQARPARSARVLR